MKYIVIKQADSHLTNKRNNKDPVGCMNDYHSMNIVLVLRTKKLVSRLNFSASFNYIKQRKIIYGSEWRGVNK